ncbi:uncharacterized protein [Eurosta solidaginis]
MKYIRLFELYKQRPYLWQKNAPNYMKNWKTQKALEIIGKELGCSGQEAKMRFRSMKQTYQQVAKKIAQNGGDGNTEVQWRFFKYLSFLSSEITKYERVDITNLAPNNGSGNTESQWRFDQNISPLQGDNSLSESVDDKKPEFNNVKTLMDFTPNCETSEASYSQPSCSKYVETFTPEIIPEKKYSEERQKISCDAVATNNNTKVFQAFGNTISNQLEGFPEEEAYQLMADIQSFMSQRKVALIKKTYTTSNQVCPVPHQRYYDNGTRLENETNESNNSIKVESINLDEY